METVNEIHNRMLSNTSSELDRSNGSFVYDVERAGAIEFAKQQADIDLIRAKQDIYNLTSEELTRFVYQRTGLTRRTATRATLQVVISGAEGATIRPGDVVATDTVNFVSLEEQSIGASGSMVVTVQAEQYGRIGNVPTNTITRFPTTIPGLVNVYNPEAATNGYEAESDESLIERYFDKLQKPGKSGNNYHYEEWAKEVSGVGDVKVFPRFNGPLTMRVVIIDQYGLPASESLVAAVESHITDSMPFGVEELLVEAATPVPLNLTVLLTMADGYTEVEVIQAIKDNIANYLTKNAFKSSFISYAQIGALIIDTEGVLDYQVLLVNGGTGNIPIASDAVAVMGGINE